MNKVTAERWWEIIREQPSSGLSIAAYCRQRRVPEASFFAWRRKLRRDTAHFAEVRIAPEPPPESSGIEVRLSNGRCVLVRAGFDRQTLLGLLATLEHGGHPASPEAACGAAGPREVGR